MKNISIQYQELKEGKMNKHQFLRNARMMFPSFVTNHNSFEDSVTILKSKGLLNEGEAVKGTPDKTPTYDSPTPDVETKYKKVEQSPEVDEQDGIYPATTLTDIPKEKKNKKVKNESDGLEPIKDNDSKNELKKVKQPLSENITNTIDTKKVIKLARKAGQLVPDAESDLISMASQYGDNIPKKRVLQILSNYDIELSDLRNIEAPKQKTLSIDDLAAKGFFEEKLGKEIDRIIKEALKKNFEYSEDIKDLEATVDGYSYFFDATVEFNAEYNPSDPDVGYSGGWNIRDFQISDIENLQVLDENGDDVETNESKEEIINKVYRDPYLLSSIESQIERILDGDYTSDSDYYDDVDDYDY